MKKNTTFMSTALLLAVVITAPSFAQKGLYLGAGLGSAANGGDIGEDYDAGGGAHFLLGFKASEKLGFELEYGGYEQKLKEESDLVAMSAFGQINLNMKYFLGAAEQRTFRPYVSGGLGLSAFAWEYTETAQTVLDIKDKDALGALSLIPGAGFEVMLGRIAALNVNARYSFNGWGKETSEGVKLEGEDSITGNTFLLNFGLILHL